MSEERGSALFIFAPSPPLASPPSHSPPHARACAQGHSRAIVGVERLIRRPGAPPVTSLLVLDPSTPTAKLVSALRAGGGGGGGGGGGRGGGGAPSPWRPLVVVSPESLASKRAYQLCWIEGRALAGAAEKESLKTLCSMHLAWTEPRARGGGGPGYGGGGEMI